MIDTKSEHTHTRGPAVDTIDARECVYVCRPIGCDGSVRSWFKLYYNEKNCFSASSLCLCLLRRILFLETFRLKGGRNV